MNTNQILSVISSIRGKANEFITEELKNNGITDIAPSHGDLLHILYKNDGIPMKEITENIHKKKNTVSVLVDKLEKNGYITKKTDETDKRITRIYLTEKGRDLQPLFTAISQKLLGTAYTGFSDAQKESLMTLLAALETNFG